MIVVREAVLLIGFNRPQEMKQVISSLRAVKPTRLYVAVDGPRSNIPADIRLVGECRALIQDVDWPCDVRTQFQDTNLGCGVGVSSAISWFFANEESGIILEDDILPDPSFFEFCDVLLDRYRNDPRVFAISGANHVPRQALTWPDEPYRFSTFTHVWGWATWRRSWEKHEVDCSDWRRRLPIHRLLARSHFSLAESLYWAVNWELTARGAVDTWDYQLSLASLSTNALVATSNVNLVRNIGFGGGATHTLSGDPGLMPIGSQPLPLADVPVRVDEEAARWTMKYHCRATVLGGLDRIRHHVRSRRSK